MVATDPAGQHRAEEHPTADDRFVKPAAFAFLRHLFQCEVDAGLVGIARHYAADDPRHGEHPSRTCEADPYEGDRATELRNPQRPEPCPPEHEPLQRDKRQQRRTATRRAQRAVHVRADAEMSAKLWKDGAGASEREV